MTAAHELVERGFEVTVYERDTDWESAAHRFPCAVGGMAKSQWGLRKGSDAAGKAPERTKRSSSSPPGTSSDVLQGDALIAQAGVAQPGAAVKDILPGEHGFRFFPGFYRHVFDTMRRIPLSRPGTGENEGPYDRPIRSVYDNLVPTAASGMGLEGNGRNYALEFPRTPPQSAREVLDLLGGFLRGAGYNLRDISKFTLKLFQYMTSSNLRRREQYETISWWDFIEGESFSQPMRHDLDVAPAILGALVARKSDARTQGSVSVQLILDQYGGGERTDALLNGPTTDAWFKPWRDYLKYRGVDFFQGTLVDFDVDHVGGVERVLPRVEVLTGDPANPVKIVDGSLFTARDAYYVIATALPDLTGRPPEDEPQGELQEGLARKFIRAAEHLSGPPRSLKDFSNLHSNPSVGGGDARDFVRLGQLETLNWNVTEDSLLQHLIGVQYFFDYNDRQFVTGHSVYLDSPWRLSAIS